MPRSDSIQCGNTVTSEVRCGIILQELPPNGENRSVEYGCHEALGDGDDADLERYIGTTYGSVVVVTTPNV